MHPLNLLHSLLSPYQWIPQSIFSIVLMEGEKIRKILLVFTLLSWVLLLLLIKNSGKDCLDGKMRVAYKVLLIMISITMLIQYEKIKLTRSIKLLRSELWSLICLYTRSIGRGDSSGRRALRPPRDTSSPNTNS